MYSNVTLPSTFVTSIQKTIHASPVDYDAAAGSTPSLLRPHLSWVLVSLSSPGLTYKRSSLRSSKDTFASNRDKSFYGTPKPNSILLLM